jgi:response regulator RpfG family c-di-GMP phosphodiesterase
MAVLPQAEDEEWLIAFVDDDQAVLGDYSKGLRFFLKVPARRRIELFHDVGRALEFAVTCRHKRALWILDSMMPYNSQFDDQETQAGSLTGIALLRQLKGLPHGQNAHFLIVTNYDKAAIERALKEHEKVEVFKKLECSPKQLASVVDKIIRDHSAAAAVAALEKP